MGKRNKMDRKMRRGKLHADQQQISSTKVKSLGKGEVARLSTTKPSEGKELNANILQQTPAILRHPTVKKHQQMAKLQAKSKKERHATKALLKVQIEPILEVMQDIEEENLNEPHHNVDLNEIPDAQIDVPVPDPKLGDWKAKMIDVLLKADINSEQKAEEDQQDEDEIQDKEAKDHVKAFKEYMLFQQFKAQTQQREKKNKESVHQNKKRRLKEDKEAGKDNGGVLDQGDEEEDSETEDSSNTSEEEEEARSTDSASTDDESIDTHASHSHHHHRRTKRKEKEKEKHHRKQKKKKRSLSADGSRSRKVLRRHWGTVNHHDPLGALMEPKERDKITTSLKGVEPFYRKLEEFEKPLHSPARFIREADARLHKDLLEMRVVYDKEMELLNDVVNSKWKRARTGCLQLLDLTIDRLTNINLERYAFRGAKKVSEEYRSGHTEPTTRPSYEEVSKRLATQSKQLRNIKEDQFFPGGRRPRSKAGRRRRRHKPPWGGGAKRYDRREGQYNAAPTTSHQQSRTSNQGAKQTSYKDKRQNSN
jgi:hypothetical protein